ncbi:MAG: hypothetical protein JWM11_4589 [Planctomycetaceae bacterium]|nr:hypothetical protein [Planctomycetaceae bacterium]
MGSTASNVRAGGADVYIGAIADGFDKTLDATEKRLKAFGVNALAMGTKLAGLGVGLGVGLVGMVKSFANTGSAMSDMAARTGDTSKNLSAIDYAAKKTGTSLETVEGGLSKMSDTISGAMSGQHDSILLLAKLGLSAGSLKGKLPTEQLEMFADAISRISNNDKKIDLVKQVFGKSGTALIPLLDQGKAGIEKLKQEAERLGLVMSGPDAAAAVKLSDSFGMLSSTIGGVVNKFSSALAPVLTSAIDYLTVIAGKVGMFVNANRALAPQAAIIAAGLTTAGVAIAALGAAFYVTAPLVQLGMIGARAATLGFSAACVLASAVTGTLSLVMKGASTALTVASLAYRAVTGTIGLAISITKSFAMATVATTAITALSAAGYGTVAKALNVLLWTTRLGSVAGFVLTGMYVTQAAGVTLAGIAMAGLSATMTIAGMAVSALGALMTVLSGNIGLVLLGIVGLTAVGVALAGGLLMLGRTGVSAGKAIYKSIASAFGGILDSAKAVPGTISGYFTAISASAQTMFSSIVSAGSSAMASAVTFFTDLLKTGQETFGGISDAISAGDIQLAVDVLWAGINVSWIKGVAGITGAWQLAMVSLEGLFDNAVAYILKGLMDLSGEALKLGIELDPTISRKNKDIGKDMTDQGIKMGKDFVDDGVKDRQAKRDKRIDDVKKSGPSTDQMLAEVTLAELVAKAGEAARAIPQVKADEGKAATNAALVVGSSMNSSAAQANGSAGAASTIAKAYNAQGGDIPSQQLAITKESLAELKKAYKLAEKQLKKNGLKIVEKT